VVNLLIRIGIASFDTSHAVEFTKRINHVDVSQDQWVDGARVVMAWPGGPTSFADEEVISSRTHQMGDYGVQIVESPEDMIGEVEGILLEAQEGGLHLQQAKPFIEAGLPIFVDKPFTCSLSDAKRLAELARSHNVSIFSASSLRYALELQNIEAQDIGGILGAEVYSPAPPHPKNPGLFNYGIHGVETLYSIMEAGCRSVVCIWDERWEKVVGRWQDGRIGGLRGIRKGAGGYGFTVFGGKKIVSSAIDTRYIYRELLKRIVKMFETKEAPLPIEETVEIIAFIEASLRSVNQSGVEENLCFPG